jgi:hypothetical protein
LPQPPPVQRDRNNKNAVLKQLTPGTVHGYGHYLPQIGTVLVFQLMDQRTRGVRINGGGPRPAKRRRICKRRRRQRSLSKRMWEWGAINRAERRLDETYF